MDRDIELDRLPDRASKAALESLDAKVDVQQRLHQLLERAPAWIPSRPARTAPTADHMPPHAAGPHYRSVGVCRITATAS